MYESYDDDCITVLGLWIEFLCIWNVIFFFRFSSSIEGCVAISHTYRVFILVQNIKKTGLVSNLILSWNITTLDKKCCIHKYIYCCCSRIYVVSHESCSMYIWFIEYLDFTLGSVVRAATHTFLSFFFVISFKLFLV